MKAIMQNIVGLAAFAAFLLGPSAFGAQLTYQGRLLRPDNTPVDASLVRFKVQIRTPGTENCLLYEEEHRLDMSSTNGAFALRLGGDTVHSSNTEPFTLATAFRNLGTLTFTSGKCAGGGTTYATSPEAGRRLVVAFDDGPGWEELPAQTIAQVPQALESLAVGGFEAGSLLRVADGSGAPQAVPALTPAQYDELIDLADGHSASYVPASDARLTDSRAPLAHGHSYADLQNHAGAYLNYRPNGVECADGQLLKWTASDRWECANESAGGGGGSEATTVVNLGTAGVGVFKQLNAAEIQLKKIDAASGAVTVTDDGGNGKINIGVNAELGGLSALASNGFVKRTGAGAYSASPSIGFGDLGAGAFANNTGLVVSDGANFQNKACAPNEILKWLSPTGWTCAADAGLAAETDPKVGANTANHLSKWDGSALVASGVFESGGKVGIGTASPGAPLTVVGEIRQNNNSAFYSFYDNTGGTRNGYLQISSTDSALVQQNAAPMRFFTSNTERARIDASGNLGLGTTNPQLKLHVIGNALIESGGVQSYIQMNSSTGAKAYFGASVDGGLTGGITAGDTVARAQGGTKLHLATDGGRLTLDANGYVGIGTTTPRAKVDVSGSIVAGAAVSNATTTIDFATGNTQYTALSCQPFVLHNLKDGGQFSLYVQNTTSATCSFAAYSDAGTTSLTVRMPLNHAATYVGYHTVYQFSVVGTAVYVTWMTGL